MIFSRYVGTHGGIRKVSLGLIPYRKVPAVQKIQFCLYINIKGFK